MMIQEFEQLVGKLVGKDDYQIIEKVYTWHPAIKESGGKQQMAQLYKEFGMSVIRGMEEVADHMMKLAKEEQELNKRFVILKKRRSMLAHGDTSLEKMIVLVEKEFTKANTPELFKVAIKKIRKESNGELVDKALVILNLEEEAK